MRLIYLCATVLFFGSAVSHAQGLAMPPVPQPSYMQLKTYLNLSDAQLQALEDIYKSRISAQQAVYQQINAKQTQLNQLLANGTSDAAAVGQLLIDIHNLQKQLPIPASTFRDQALKVLTPDQTAKLPALVAVLQLQQAAYQAGTLDLVDAPAPPPIMPLPGVAPPATVSPQP